MVAYDIMNLCDNLHSEYKQAKTQRLRRETEGELERQEV